MFWYSREKHSTVSCCEGVVLDDYGQKRANDYAFWPICNIIVNTLHAIHPTISLDAFSFLIYSDSFYMNLFLFTNCPSATVVVFKSLLYEHFTIYRRPIFVFMTKKKDSSLVLSIMPLGIDLSSCLWRLIPVIEQSLVIQMRCVHFYA